jgi:hypothetical protein
MNKTMGESAKCRLHRRSILIISFACLNIFTPDSFSTIPGNSYPTITVGFTAAMISEMNRNDAAASIAVLAEMIIKKRAIQAIPKAEIYEDLSLLRKAIKSGDADVVSLRVDEYLEMEPDGTLEPAFVGIRDGSWAEQYLLLTHAQNGIRDLPDLHAKSLILLTGRRTGLAGIWLDTVLRESDFPESTRFFSEIRESTKVSKTILPVFFRQGDACLVTRSGLNTMATLNPQVGRQLIVLKQSPAVLPSLVCLRRNMDSNLSFIATAQAGKHSPFS